MKKVIFGILALAALPLIAAKPLFVGHRGSGYGVENTAQSFRTGIDLG